MHPLTEAAKPIPGCIGLGPVLPGRTTYLRGDGAELMQGEMQEKDDEAARKALERGKKRMGFTWSG